MGLFSFFKKKSGSFSGNVPQPAFNQTDEAQKAKIAALEEQVRMLQSQLKEKEFSEEKEPTKPVPTPSASAGPELSNVKFEGMFLSKEQAEVIQNVLNSADNFFITGKAGTGKSTVLRYLTKKSENALICAPTGIAAINVKGMTVHKLFGIPIGPIDLDDPRLRYVSEDLSDLLKKATRIIIDEVSMVRSDLMAAIDLRLRVARDRNVPFGGCQIICFGDLYQLPPVVASDQESAYLNDLYGTPYFFGAPATKTFRVVELTQVFRQKDKGFILALNDIREANEHVAEAVLFLNDKSGTAPMPAKPLNIVLTNKKAEEINSVELSKLPGIETTYIAEVGGESPPAPKEVICVFNLSLKIGASVMLLRNDKEKRYVNGSVGEVIALEKDKVVVKVNGRTIPIEQATWSKYEYKRNKETKKLIQVEVGFVRQFPVKLAYAITAHKSQGQTFDDVVIDFSDGNAFAAGQTYVALSRCRSLERLHLAQPLKASDIFADKSVKEYMKNAEAKRSH